MVNRQAGSDLFSDWQIQATAQIVRDCWAKYPNLKHVGSHAKLEPTQRSDPGAGFPLARLKQLVLASDAEDGVPTIAQEAPRVRRSNP